MFTPLHPGSFRKEADGKVYDDWVFYRIPDLLLTIIPRWPAIAQHLLVQIFGRGIGLGIDLVLDEVINLPSGMDKAGEVIGELYDTLTGIQTGKKEAPEGWIRHIC